MIQHCLTVDQWIDRCTMRLGQLLPALDPAEVARRAAELRFDAYEYSPEDAAEIYALELPPMEAESVGNYGTASRASWVLAFVMDGANSAQLGEGLCAGERALEAAGVSPFNAVSTQFRLEQWDTFDFSEEYALSAAENHAYDSLCTADDAANEAAVLAGADPLTRGSLVARWPSKVRFEAARYRWLGRQAKVS